MGTALAYMPGGYDVDAPALIVYAGDSITRGEGAAADRGYTDLLHSNSDSIYPDYAGDDMVSWFSGFSAIDVAVSGGTTDTVVQTELPAIANWMDTNLPNGIDGPAVFFVTVGGNDLQSGLLPWVNPTPLVNNALDNVETMITWMQDPVRFPHGSRIYITNVYEPSDGEGSSSCFFGVDYTQRLADLESYNEQLRDLGVTYDVAVLDMRSHFLGHGANAGNTANPHHDASDPSRWFASDCIHPNNRGHHEVRRLFLGAADGSLTPY